MSSSYHHKKFAHLRIPREEIASSTNNFSEANLIRKVDEIVEYRGQLLRCGQSVDILAQVWPNRPVFNEHFWIEVSMLSILKHENLTSVVGFCEEDDEIIMIYKHYHTLDTFLKDPTLTWMRRLQIFVGVAQALGYLEYKEGRDFSVIHCSIRGENILLDDQWNAKLYGFYISLKQIASTRNPVRLSPFYGLLAPYDDPTSAKSGYASHKLDIYSLGVVLFEGLTGEKSVKDRLLAPLAKTCYEEGRLDDMIFPGLQRQMDPRSVKIVAETAYYCLKEQLSQRPNIQKIVKKLTEALECQRKHENPFLLKPYSMVEGTTSTSLKHNNLEHLKIPFIDIVSAIENFAKIHIIGIGGFGEVYKAELKHFDNKHLLASKDKNIGEHPKKRSIVAIKRILMREDEHGEEGFVAEIELLTNCKHPNIVSLLGFCKEGRHMILVYEYMSNGSLDNYLGSTDNFTNLTWVQRLKICIDIARGLNYLHTKVDEERNIIHRDIKSGNILLSENWEAKIADFGLSKFRPKNNQLENNTLYTQHIVGTPLYLDPEYDKYGRLKNETDIYSFGVVLFEILSGTCANDAIYIKEDSNGIASVVRRRFKEGTIKHMVDPRLMEESGENDFSLNTGPHPESLDGFLEIAYLCVAETQAERPTAQVIITKLEEALSFQENPDNNLRICFEDISRAVQDFSDDNLITYYTRVYRGEFTHANQSHSIVAKVFKTDAFGKQSFLRELQVLSKYKHENIVDLVGYCNEEDRQIIVSKYVSRGSLAWHLSDSSLTWMKRLEICVDIASGMDFLHGGGLIQELVIHRDINAYHILLDHDWKAKICSFTDSFRCPIDTDVDSVIDNEHGHLAYRDPLYMEMGFLTTKSDIYSFGLVLFEILCGGLLITTRDDGVQELVPEVMMYYEDRTLHKRVLKSIWEQIAPRSLSKFQKIAYQCLHKERHQRPTAHKVLLQLRKALEYQRDFDIWTPKLPDDYVEIGRASNIPRDIKSMKGEKGFYDLLCNGILLYDDKVLFTLGGKGERTLLISAKTFSYINHCLHKWRCVPQSRFPVVAKMFDISNLRMKIQIEKQFLSPDVVYGVYLVFKFCDPRKVLNKPFYVNLKYENGRKTSHSYFATWRDNEWMMIELYRFLNNKEDIFFKFLLKSLSRYYCGYSSIYVEGVEFRAIDNVKYEDINELNEVHQVIIPDSNVDLLQQLSTKCEDIMKISENDGADEKSFLTTSEVNGKKHLLLSAKAALYDYSNVKLFKTKSSTQSRFPEVMELLRQQVFRMNCKIKSELLSPDTDYACYLVFKLSEKCRGLHCPVKVRDLLHRNNKEAEIVYLRPPSPWNLHDTYQSPEQRVDGWMEVKIWKFNLNHELKNDRLRVNLKLISYEGTMSGLIVCGLEFRPL